MLKQNIKIAIVAIIGLLTFWLIMFNFIKIDRTCECVISFQDSIPIISIEPDTSAYIQKNKINQIKVEFNKQYFDCHITFSEYTPEYSNFLITVPSEVYKPQSYIVTKLIVDSQNLYLYWFKK